MLKKVEIFYERALPSHFSSPLEREWIYLGKSIKKRRKVKEILGASNYHPLCGRLHGVAREVRESFLNCVSAIGEKQPCLSWASSLFAWKIWVISDFFLLVCYLKLADTFLQESLLSKKNWVLVIEDPWLFKQLRKNYRHLDFVRFHGRVLLRPKKFFLFAIGFLKRLYWLLRVVKSYGKHLLAWRKFPKAPKEETIAIYSYPDQRCFVTPGGWTDPFLPNLSQWLEEWGYSVQRFGPPEAVGFEPELAQRAHFFHPLILYASWAGVVNSFFTFWRARWKDPLWLEGIEISLLAQREWWCELGRSTPCLYRMYYECFKKMIGKGKWSLIIFPFENQPWEKLTVLCAREKGIRTIGIQHGVFSQFSLAYFWGEAEEGKALDPDVILVSGPYLEQLLKQGIMESRKVVLSGSLRYNHLSRSRKRGARQRGSSLLKTVLVTLPIDPWMTKHLLASIGDAFPDGGKKDGLLFLIKPHPALPIKDRDMSFPFLRAPKSFEESLSLSDLVLFVGSTTGPEALALGIPALRYVPELLVNVDPSEIYGDLIETCRDDNLAEILLSMLRKGESPSMGVKEEQLSALTAQLFAPVNKDLLQEVFQQAVN